MSVTELGRLSRLDLFPRAVAVVAATTGALVLIGWFFDATTLKGVMPGWTLMKANTAMGFILCGVALWATQGSGEARLWRAVGHVCSAIVLLLGLFTLGEYLSGLDFGIDQLLIRELTHLPGDIPGRMAVDTALSFSAAGAALLLLNREKGDYITGIHALLLVPFVAAGSALIGYAYDIEEFLRVKLDYTPMAFPTAALFILLVLGIASARPQYPFRRFMVSDSAAGIMVRRLLPGVIILILVIGWLIQRGYHAGYFSEVFGLALFSAVSIAGLAILVVWSARTFDAADTRRKDVEEALRESSELIRDLYNNVPNGYLSADAKGIVTEMNDTLLRWLQYSREEIIGKTLGNFLTAEGIKAAEAATKILQERGWTRDDAYDLIRRDGSIFPVLASSTAVLGPDGKFVMSRCSVFDNTERKRAEEQVRAAALYARSLIEASPDPLVTISADGKITDVNDATRRATGVTRDALIGSDFSDYFTEPEKARAGYREAFAKGFVTRLSPAPAPRIRQRHGGAVQRPRVPQREGRGGGGICRSQGRVRPQAHRARVKGTGEGTAGVLPSFGTGGADGLFRRQLMPGAGERAAAKLAIFRSHLCQDCDWGARISHGEFRSIRLDAGGAGHGSGSCRRQGRNRLPGAKTGRGRRPVPQERETAHRRYRRARRANR